MLNVNSLPKIQHYVPQFILKRFTANNKSQIFVFDKENENIFKTNIKNIAAEKDFYNVEYDDYTVSLETSLSDLEAKASEVVKNIIEFESIFEITKEEKELLSFFLAIQSK